MTKNEISRQLQENHQAFIAMMLGFPEADFCKNAPGKWTPGQQLEHILLSVKPLVMALGYPKFILKIIFGKANRVSKTNEALISKYKMALENGGTASGRFVPKSVSFQRREAIAERLSALVAKLNARISRYSEADLDTLVLPHPLLGKLTLREMLYFTAYHVTHHHELTKRDLNLYQPAQPTLKLLIMNSRKRTVIICILLVISIGNYSRIQGTENIRTIAFVAIFTIGALSSLLLREIAQKIKSKWFV